MPTPYWNHNTHYHPLALRHVRPDTRALDVGSGEGLLTRRVVAAGAAEATGLDTDPTETARATRAAAGDGRLHYVTGDVLTAPLDERAYDLVTCVATLHHLDLEAGLARLRSLTAPGGHLVVVGLARLGSPVDAVLSLSAVPAAALARLLRHEWEHGSPVAEPATTYADVRDAARRHLPGARWRRHLYWRYSLTWQAPG
ncbi:bifunctional 2-polyprenyl-6-hydroxyphenol methylase/3-demethylubiquinol 3-O-methyltransferase UbiG [Cellulomonas cellasea]|uniref:SAM-dependent methyltransferase n=1 Tax=Cellulomonas cellasea TaxID=43670 RepID=A0A7W4UDF6_9CELL|nr:class I SAM-dependent methyltransferase [Cellulomonas cellasea]MBB2921513.1 SAM-dependent methyltransferase [Cellulomonas cellasea]